MKVLTRILAVAIAFAVVAGGAQVYVSSRRPVPAAVKNPGAPAPGPPSESPAPSQPPSDPVPPETLPPAPKPTKKPVTAPSKAQGKMIEVSIDDQELIAWQDGTIVYRFVISTGKAGYETPKGNWRIHTKYENRWSRKWKVWMPYAMFWHPEHGYAFHELPYKDGQPGKRLGASKLGRADSHGCVRVNVGDAKKLYDWAPVGTSVWVH
ncbi:MAG TPA: L,D-transpeptidase [Actinomycetota bacterium]|nr:L,D-transpeptidase [Actinomycetota bacterium]